MKKFIFKVCLFSFIIYAPIVAFSYFIDPAGLFHARLLDYAVEALLDGNIIETFGDRDEGLFQEKMIEGLNEVPETVVLGSSRVMYLPWPYENCYLGGMSGSYLGDYYAIIGLLEENNKLPKRIIIGADPWAFMTAYSDGRHSSIKKYALITHNNIVGKIDDVSTNVEISNAQIKKYRELLSFPYFQASIASFRLNGLSYYLKPQDERIVVVENAEISEKAKILSNGQIIMSLSEIGTVEDNRKSAKKLIEDGSIYQLGTEMKTVNKQNFEDFEKLIVYLQNKGTEVHIYLPSWYPDIYDYFRSNSSFTGVLEAEEMIRKMAKKLNIDIHGSYDPEKGQVSEEDYADWLHLKAEKMLVNYNVIIE